MAEASRVDAELVRRGLARSRREAVALVEAGRVRRSGHVVVRPAERLGADEAVDVDRPAEDAGYASRAAYKLEGALAALDRTELAVRVNGRACLDLGASTGGFTDVLLRRGARHVVAVDVGHGQLVERLRADARVDVREGLNVRDLLADDLPEPAEVVVGDLSFISLGLVLPAVARVAGHGGDVLLLVKPQFEVGRERLGAGGVVREPLHMTDAIVGVARQARALGLRALAVVPSPLPGPHGNREFVLRLVAGSEPARAAIAGAAAGAGAPRVPDDGSDIDDGRLVQAARRAVAEDVAGRDDTWSAPPVPRVFVVGGTQPSTQEETT